MIGKIAADENLISLHEMRFYGCPKLELLHISAWSGLPEPENPTGFGDFLKPEPETNPIFCYFLNPMIPEPEIETRGYPK